MANSAIKKQAQAGATYTISSDEKSLRVNGFMDNGTINVDGFTTDFNIKIGTAGNVNLAETDKDTNLQTIIFNLKVGTSSTLKFIDGSLTFSKSASGAITVGTSTTALTTKSVALSGFAGLNEANAYNVDGPAVSTATGSTFTLTTGINEINGTSANELIDATEDAAGAATLTAMDTIDGGLGNDTLKVVDATAINTTVAGLTVVNVENVSLKTASTVTTDTSTWTGATALTINAGSDVNATAAATTDITSKSSTLTGAAGAVTVNGGKNVTVTAADTSTTGAASANTILVGGTTAAAGDVSVTYTETISDAADAGVAGSSITATGGKTITVNQNAVVGAASAAADVLTLGTVTVNGNASTTAATVKQSAATAAWAVAGDKIKITNGAVNITDTNATTAADTLATVTLENFGATRIDSSALSTLNVKGGATIASGNLDLRKTATDTTTSPTTLTVNASGVIGNLGVAASSTMANAYTAVNVASSAATTFADAGLAANKTLTVSGAGVTTFTAFTAANNAALTSVVSTGAGLTIGTELATNVAVTGGDGVETISVGQTTKAINLGGGNDVVTISNGTLGAGGSVNGGTGTNTLVANTNGSSTIANPAFANFSTLRVAGAAAEGAHNSAGFTALEVGALAGASSFTNVAAGAGLTQLAALGNDLTVTLANATGTADVFNLTLRSAAAIGAAGDVITVAGVERVNVTSTDTNTTAHQNTLELAATSATTLNVSGNAGLIVVNADASITSFDASSVVLGKVTDSGVTFDSTNATVAEIVNIKGTNGVDVLTGSITAKDIINAGSGADTLVFDGGSDEFTGGAGNDVFDIDALGTATVHLTIKDLTAGDTIQINGIDTGTATWNATKVSLGALATFAQYLDAAAAGNGGTNSIARWFQFENNTYLVNDNGAGATFAVTDAVVKIAGLVDLKDSTLATTIITVV
jgi:S-layer protein